MPNGPGARREPRFTANQRVEVSIQGPQHSRPRKGLIVDISEHGLSFTFGDPLDAGDTVTVEYEGCRVVGEVRNCRAREYASDRRYLVGVAVQHVTQGDEIWGRLMEQCCSGA